MGNPFEKATNEELTAMSLNRSNSLQGLNMFLSGAVPLNNELKDKTDNEINALLPKKGPKAIAIRNWLIAHSDTVGPLLAEFRGLLDA